MEDASARLEEARERAQSIKNVLLRRVDPATDPITPKFIYKTLVFREAVLWRTSEMSSAALLGAENGHWVTTALISRGIFENAAALHYLLYSLQRWSSSDGLDEIDAMVMRLLLGNRWQGHTHQAINVMTMLDRLEKTLKGCRSIYDELSEVTHPNWLGTVGAFSRSNPTLILTDFGPYINGPELHREQALGGLNMSLLAVEYFYDATVTELERITALMS